MLAYSYDPNIVKNNLPGFKTCTSEDSDQCFPLDLNFFYNGTSAFQVNNECELKEYKSHCPCLLYANSFEIGKCPSNVYYSHYMKM